MKQLLKRATILFVSIVIFFSMGAVPTIASEETDEIDTIKKSINKWIDNNTLLKDSLEWNDTILNYDGRLNSLDSNDQYYHYTVVDGKEVRGYIICNQSGSVIEFSATESPYSCYFNSDDSNNLFYSPGFHLILKENELEEIAVQHMNDSARRNDKFPIKSYSDYYKFISGVPDYNYTVSCIPTAIGNVLGYWDANGYPNLNTGTYTSMINEIASYMSSVTSNSSIPSAVASYCHASGRYPSNFSYSYTWYPSFSNYASAINLGRPTLVGFASGNTYYTNAHMTAGVGYYYSAGDTARYIYVHDAWATTATDYFVQWSSYNDYIGVIIP